MSRIKIPKERPHIVKANKPTIFQRMAKIREAAILKAIREHPVIGIGTGSVVDQCFSDAEVLEELDREGIYSIPRAIKHFAIWENVEIEIPDLEDEEDEVHAPANLNSEEEEGDSGNPIWWEEWEDYTRDPNY